jgi:hypothetical protein
LAICLGWALAKSTSAVQNQNQAVPPQDTAAHKSNDPGMKSSVISNSMPSLAAHDKTDQCRYPKTPKWKTGAELIGIAAVVIYTLVTMCLWCVTDESYRTGTRAQIVVTNLAWAVMDQPDKNGIVRKNPFYQICDPDGTGIHYLCFNVSYTNGGKSPANEVQPVFHVVQNDQNPETTITNFPLPKFQQSAGFSSMSSEPHAWLAHTSEPICEDSKVPHCIPRQQANEMVLQDLSVYIYGVVQYSDIFNDIHAARVCFWRPKMVASEKCPLPGGCFDNCRFGNSIDKNGDVPRPKKPWYCKCSEHE